jgi:chromosome partitioning protein
LFVVAIASQKGGAGKTTLSLALAVHAENQGWPTVVLDMDQQATATIWKDWRGPAAPDVFAAQPPRLPIILERVAQQGARLVILDTPPQANQIADAAMQAAHLVLVPCRPTAFDLQSVTTTARSAAAMRRPAYAVLNAVRARSSLTDDAVKALEAAKVTICPVRIGDRVDFQNPLSSGKVAVEWDPGGKAAGEIASLWDWLIAMEPSSKTSIKPKSKQASL